MHPATLLTSLPERLYAAGVTDLISVSRPGALIAPNSTLSPDQMGKAPAMLASAGYVHFRGWRQHPTTREDVTRWVEEGSNIGLRADYYPAVDIDVTDAALALWIEEQAWQDLGYAPVRIGKAPKRALVYQTEEPFGKRSLAFERGDAHHLIEILGAGQQYLVYGRHPSGSDYTFITDPLEQPLTLITAQQVDTFLASMGEALTSLGWKITTHQHGVGNGLPRPKSELTAPSPELLQAVVAALPNDGDWHTFQNVGYAIAGAAEHDEEGRALFHAWASKSEKYRAEQTDQLWRKLEPRHAGWQQLAARCDAASVRVPALDQYRGEQAADAFTVVREPDRGQRLAALVGDAALVLLFEAAELDDGQLRGRFLELAASAQRKDGLQDRMDNAMEVMTRRGLAFTSRSRFNILARGVLREALKGLSAAEAELVRDACFIALAPADVLTSQLLTGCAFVSDAVGDADPELVEGIPVRGLASIIAPPKTGKSFIALELAARIASEPVVSELDELTGEVPAQRFGGSPVNYGSVLYFASEDEMGMALRLKRWRARHGDARHLYLLRGVPSLSEPVKALTTVIQVMDGLPDDAPPVRLLVIDIYRSAITGSEDKSEIAQQAMETAKLLGRMVGCAVMLVHHTPKASPEEPRGSGAFLGAMDFMGVVMQEGRTVKLKVKARKHGELPEHPRVWHLEDPGVLVEGPAVEDAGGGVVQRRVDALFDLVQQCGPQTQTSMWEMIEDDKALWPNKRAFFNSCRIGLEKGFLEMEGKTKYRAVHSLAAPETL